MPGWPELITAALINGALLSLTLVVIMLISGAVALDMWVGDYPPDIRDKYGPMSAKARRPRPFFGVAFFCWPCWRSHSSVWLPCETRWA